MVEKVVAHVSRRVGDSLKLNSQGPLDSGVSRPRSRSGKTPTPHPHPEGSQGAWLGRAAAQGNPDAQNNLGQMYADGEGMQQDYVQAARWYRKAAEHVPDRGGAGQGRNNLGLLYMEGLGVPKDYIQAYMWFSLSNYESNLSYAKDQLTPAQVFEAERMAEKWKGNHPEP